MIPLYRVVSIRSCIISFAICNVAPSRPDRYHCILLSCLFSIISHVALIIWHFEWVRTLHGFAERTLSQCNDQKKSISSRRFFFWHLRKKGTHKSGPEIYASCEIVLHNTLWMGYTQCVRFPKSIFIDGILSATYGMTSTIDLILFDAVQPYRLRSAVCDTMVMPRDYVVVR